MVQIVSYLVLASFFCGCSHESPQSKATARESGSSFAETRPYSDSETCLNCGASLLRRPAVVNNYINLTVDSIFLVVGKVDNLSDLVSPTGGAPETTREDQGHPVFGEGTETGIQPGDTDSGTILQPNQPSQENKQPGQLAPRSDSAERRLTREQWVHRVATESIKALQRNGESYKRAVGVDFEVDWSTIGTLPLSADAFRHAAQQVRSLTLNRNGNNPSCAFALILELSKVWDHINEDALKISLTEKVDRHALATESVCFSGNVFSEAVSCLSDHRRKPIRAFIEALKKSILELFGILAFVKVVSVEDQSESEKAFLDLLRNICHQTDAIEELLESANKLLTGLKRTVNECIGLIRP